MKHLFYLLIILINIYSCKKDNGRFYLAVIPPTDTTITDLKVYDANGQIPVDGKYYLVESNLELSYKLNHIVQYSIKDWTEDMGYDEYTFTDISMNLYKGEFEKDSKDKYYTLVINYTGKRDNEPIYNQYGDYYFYSYNYSDNSKLTYSFNPK